MYLLQNPVLQRELLVNLRTHRSFVLLLIYQLLLAAVVYFAWPQASRLEANADAARRLVDLFFLGQYIIASMMAPSFAAGTISGEKERHTYEMLLASPMRPSAIVMGKLTASLTHLAILIFASLPIVMLCLPLGGVSLYEVLAAYLGLTLSVITFGMISVACSSYFRRTVSALIASYLFVLPLALIGVFAWQAFAVSGQTRLLLSVTLLPVMCGIMISVLFRNTARRLLYPPDVGSEGKEVIDIEEEAEEVIGLVIQRDKFPDRLFAPPKRQALLADGANPVYDKEIHSEIFSQGTLMLRVVIQVSMFLAIPIMAACLFIKPHLIAWYIGYVVIFNLLVGPVFSAGSVTSERERQTLDLLLTTNITPWQILWGKLIAGLRVSTVLTLFLCWPLFLAVVIFSVMAPFSDDNFYWVNMRPVAAYAVIIMLTCLTTAVVALFFSVLFKRTSVSLMSSYIVLITLFCAPLAADFFAKTFYDSSPATDVTERIGMISPFATAFSIPLEVTEIDSRQVREAYAAKTWTIFFAHLAWAATLSTVLMLGITWLFRTRWRVSQ